MSSEPEQQSEGPDGIPVAGDILAEKYRVERVLGIGGMGVVVAAMHLHLGERVALKFLLPTVATPETVERFGREARAAARIKSEHVAHVTDVGTLGTGTTYMVMEFLEGQDLSAILRESGPLQIRDAVEYIIQACDAVAEAHSLGIVHRDLKPANLFLAKRPGAPARIKVLDFGISKVMASEQPETPMYSERAMTHTRAWLGSPLYMAPEQMKSAKNVDTRTDIWSLGVILFELLTRTVPFEGTNLPELCAEILHGTAADVEQRRPDVPTELGDVIRHCLEKDPDKRFQNVGELVMALVDFAPRRARSVAERAVSLTEESGMMRPSAVPRQALDATLAEARMSPFRDSTPPPRSVRPEELVIPKAPRTPSFAPPSQSVAAFDAGNAATMIASPLQAAEPREGRSVLVPILVVLTLLASVGVTFLLLMHRDRDAQDAAASASATTSAAPPAPAASATAAATAAKASAEAATPKPAEAPSAAPSSTASPAPVESAAPKNKGPMPRANAASKPKGAAGDASEVPCYVVSEGGLRTPCKR